MKIINMMPRDCVYCGAKPGETHHIPCAGVYLPAIAALDSLKEHLASLEQSIKGNVIVAKDTEVTFSEDTKVLCIKVYIKFVDKKE